MIPAFFGLLFTATNTTRCPKADKNFDKMMEIVGKMILLKKKARANACQSHCPIRNCVKKPMLHAQQFICFRFMVRFDGERFPKVV